MAAWPIAVTINNAEITGSDGTVSNATIKGDLIPQIPDPPPDVPPQPPIDPIPPDPPIDVPPPPSNNWQWAFVTDPPLGWVLVPPGGGGKPQPIPRKR